MVESEIDVSIAGGGQAYGVTGASRVDIGSLSQVINNYYDRPRGEEPAATGSEAIPPCPYMGLAHFGLRDADVFFGRDAVIKRLAQAVNRQALTAVIGAARPPVWPRCR